MMGLRAAMRLVLAAVALVAFGGVAAAQTSTSGDIAGVVRDPSGAPLAGATAPRFVSPTRALESHGVWG